MRVVILSDTHGSRGRLLDAVREAGAFDVLVHLGDGISDVDAMRPYINADVIAVRGNNDIFSYQPDFRVAELCGQKVYMCHGHTAGVRESRERLAALAKEAGCPIALYGHTHIFADETINGVRCLNPGSIGYPGGAHGYIEMSDGGGEARIRFVGL